MLKHGVVVSAAVVMGLVLAAPTFGYLLVDFKPDPISPQMDEIGWTGNALAQRAGSVGSNDGTLPPSNQTPGGLQIQTPFSITGVPGSTINALDGSTTFYDVTLQVTGMLFSGPAVTNVIFPGITLISQPVGSGAFSLTSTGPSFIDLLSGTVNDLVIVGLAGQNTGSIQSSTVTYTSGKIYDELVSHHGTLTGTLSWSLLDIGSSGLKIGGGGLGTNLSPFDADQTGQFNTPFIPEPATLSLLGLGVGAMILGRWRRK
jgi:hypothetical protein